MRTAVFLNYNLIAESCSEGHMASCSEGHFLSVVFGRTCYVRKDTLCSEGHFSEYDR